MSRQLSSLMVDSLENYVLVARLAPGGGRISNEDAFSCSLPDLARELAISVLARVMQNDGEPMHAESNGNHGLNGR